MDVQERKLFKFPMFMLNRMGVLCLHPTSYQQKLQCIIFGSVMLFCFLSVIPQYFNMKNIIFDFVDNTESLAAFGQILVKLCVCAYNRQEFLELFKLTQHFWRTDKSSKFLNAKVNKIIRIVTIFQKMYFCALLGGIPVFLLPVCFGKKLPFGSWNLENHDVYYKSVLISHITVLPFSTGFLACFDGIFLGFCYELFTQIIILRNSLENLSIINIQSQKDCNMYYQQLKSHIQHHIFLLRFIEKLQKVYSATLFIQYLTTAPLICTEIFVSSVSTDILLIMRHGISGFIVIGQFALYCVPISYLIEEAATVSHGIYSSDWFSNNNLRLRVPIIMLIQASQKELQFKAWNLIAINNNTLFAVIKVAFSASAVFKSLKE